MAITSTRVSEKASRKVARRQRSVPFEDHVLDLRNDSPELFENYDTVAITRGLFTKLFPRGVDHENVIIELMEANLQTFRRRYDPNFEMVIRTPTTKTTPRTTQIAAAVLGSFKPDTMMRDGRALREWTWGEFRAEFKGMSLILSQYAHLSDDELIGDTIS